MNGLGTAASTVIADLLDCVCVALETDGGGTPCWCGFYPGAQVSWDYCGECSGGACGMGYVRMVNAYRSADLVNPDLSLQCTTPVTVQLAVGAVRCVPMATENGSLPDEETMWESSLAILADMTALFAAIECCPGVHILGEYNPVGPQGGCAGGEWTVWVSL